MTVQEAKISLEKNWWTFNKHLHKTHKDYVISIGEVERDEPDRFIFPVLFYINGREDEQLSGNYVVFKKTGGCRPAIFFDGSGD